MMHRRVLPRFASAPLSSLEAHCSISLIITELVPDVSFLSLTTLHAQVLCLAGDTLSMPAVRRPSLILVTGASGFSGMWITRALLEAGYSVRGTVRSRAKGRYLEDYFRQYRDAKMFEFMLVEDMAKVPVLDVSFGLRVLTFCLWYRSDYAFDLQEGAFDEALENVEGVVHVVSNLH